MTDVIVNALNRFVEGVATEPSSVVTPMMFIKAGEAKASVLSVDYFLVAVER